MKNSDQLHKDCQEIISKCIGCNNCIAECKMLQEIGKEINQIAERGPSVEEAFSCSLCGLCEAVCPVSLSPRRMFADTRTSAVKNHQISISEYRYMFPDRKNNVMSLYRELSGIQYEDLHPDRESPVAFFPGCSMLTYAPDLTRTLYTELNKEYKELTLLTDCCGLPLHQLGLKERGEQFICDVKSKLLSLQVKKLITACPNCFYQLRPVLEDSETSLITIYEALANNELFHIPLDEHQRKEVTIHDSCPDRFDGIFGTQTRKALIQKGFPLVEMNHNRQTAMCCGSGGQVTHFQPQMAEDNVKNRLDEAEKSGAEILAAYCLGCALNFAKMPSKMKIQHVVNLLLGQEQDFCGVKAQAKKLWEGPEGEKHWERIMAE